MKKSNLIMIAAMALILFASCMGKDYAEPANNGLSPYGNNELKETNVLTIAQLKAKYAAVFSKSNTAAGNPYEKVTEDIQIKGVVTSTDVQGNIFSEVAIQDETGAIIVSVSQGGIYAFLPVGTEVLLNLKDLYVGNYGLQPQIGVPAVSSKGVAQLGRMSRMTFDEHYKVLSVGKKVEPKEFDNSWNLDTDAGRLGVIKNVSFKNSLDGTLTTYANANGGAGSIRWALNEQASSKLIVYNSNFADFASAQVPTGKVNITGIFKRFNNQWEIIIRTINDVEVAPEVKIIYSNAFDAAPTDWTIDQGTLPAGITSVWAWASAAYGMKASAYVNSQRYETHARLKSPMIDLSAVTKATLTFDQAARYFGDFDQELKVQVSTDNGVTWNNLSYTGKPTGADWNFVTSTADLTSFAGKKIHISFFYNSTNTTAATWEVKNFIVK